MKKWPRPQEIFSLYPLKEDGGSVEPSLLSNNSAVWEKIKFDNTIRVCVAVPSYLACYLLSAQGVIPSVIPMTFVFSVYAVVQFSLSWFFLGSPLGRKLDYLFSFFDLIAMSMAVYFTGGTDSPLYFLYFIPLVVHAFHRDWGIVVFTGFGGVVFYAVAVFKSLDTFTPAVVTNIGARMFFMLLTVSIACLALAILRKQDEVDLKRIRRLKNLTKISESLNRLTSLVERADTVTSVIELINEGLGKPIKPWTRFLLTQSEDSLLHAFTDPKDLRNDLQQEIPVHACPVMKTNANFSLEDLKHGPECATERFSFASHVCIPVTGVENETFGVLFVGSVIPHGFKNEEMQFLQFVSKSLGLSLQRLNRMEELRKSLEMNSWVMAATIASSRSKIETFGVVADGLMGILRTDALLLQVVDRAHSRLKTVMSRGGSMPDDRSLVFPLKTLKGEELGFIRTARQDATQKISAIDIETADTFVSRAAVAIENALVHEGNAEKIRGFEADFDRKRAA